MDGGGSIEGFAGGAIVFATRDAGATGFLGLGSVGEMKKGKSKTNLFVRAARASLPSQHRGR